MSLAASVWRCWSPYCDIRVQSFFAEMGWQTGVGHGRDAQARIFCPAIDIIGNRLLSDLGIHATDGIGPAGQFNLLRTLTLLLAGPSQRKAVTGRHRVNRRFFPIPG